MENQEFEKLYMNDMTRDKLYKLFGIRRVEKIEELEQWLHESIDVNLNKEESTVINMFQKILIKNIEDWSENELSLGFIGPILNLVDFKVPYKLNFFTQRPQEAVVGKYLLIGKPDGLISSGNEFPDIPYFAFHEFKKDVNSSGDPIGQNLAAMLVGQTLNKNDDVIYGCYVVGRNWYFMVLKGKEFAISKDFSATHDDDILNIVRILKALRSILFKKLGIEITQK